MLTLSKKQFGAPERLYCTAREFAAQISDKQEPL